MASVGVSGTPVRVLIYTGKGGVGKTTCAASTALQLAAAGLRTLVVSTDPAHSLGDCLQQRLGGTPSQVAENLWGLELDALAEMRSRFGAIREVIVRQMQAHGVDEMLAEELIAFPGSLELFSVLKLADFKRAGTYEVVVVDTAPTGNTMRFLHFPEFLAPVRRALKVDQTFSRFIRPFASLWKGDVPAEEFYSSIFRLFDDIESARRELFGADTFLRFVLNPDKLSLVETQRAVSSLNVSGYIVDALVINKVLPSEVTDEFFRSWKETQRDYIAEARNCFYPLRVFEAPLHDREVLGVEPLRDFARQLYGDVNPLGRLTAEDMLQVTREGNAVILTFRVPYPVKEDLRLFRQGQELFVKVGPYEQKYQLPATFWHLEIRQARHEDNKLSIAFS